MLAVEQTVVLVGPQTTVSVVCEACARRRGEPAAIDATLRVHADVGWALCPRGHRIRIVRPGRDVHAELTSPLW